MKALALVFGLIHSAVAIVAGIGASCYLVIWLHEWLLGALVLFVGVPLAYAQFVVFEHVLRQVLTTGLYEAQTTAQAMRSAPVLYVYHCPQCQQRHNIEPSKTEVAVRCVGCNHEFVPEKVG
jgi:hypothetical protein